LPLPTYVRVRNLSNNKSIVVRVNDRGPFVHNRIIDLSYAAAMKLDMIGDGTSLVEVTAINFDQPQGDRPVRASSPPSPEAAGSTQPAATANRIYAQVGAFGERANAERRLGELARAGVRDAFIHEELTAGRILYRVRIGPIADVVQYDALVDELGAMGINDPYLISE
jgi:rare lipoprotein A